MNNNFDKNIASGSHDSDIVEVGTISAEELWSQIQEALKVRLGAEHFDLWVKPIVAVALLTDGPGASTQQLALEAPSKIYADWIRTRCGSDVRLLLKDLGGTVRDFIVTVAEEQEPLLLLTPMPEPTVPTIPDHPRTDTRPQFEQLSPVQFNPKYTFESFIEGQANRFAKAAAEGIAKEPGVRFNPLFIYGGVGLGKTHLMHAVGHAMYKQNPNARVLYISSEKFINEFINSLRFERPGAFREKYRNLDCLLIDDIQFLMGKGRSEEEFFFTFNTLFDSRKQIVISSDRPPKEMGALQDRLISRFEWGVVADIQLPDLETRIAILRKKAEMEKIYVPEEVILFIASQVKSNIRELEGALIRITAYSSLTGVPLTVDTARSALKDILRREEESAPITIEKIQDIVSRHFNLEVKELKSRRRTDAIAWPRQIAMYLARVMTELSTTEIGGHFGGKDHTTVLHACDKVKLKLAESPFISSMINKIMQEIKTGGSGENS